jgi:integrase
MPRKKLSPFVCTVGGQRPFTGLNVTKQRLDAKIAEVSGGVPIAPWTIHDLRRTGATLMASLKVPMDIVSRMLNHSPKGNHRIRVRPP